LSDREKFWWTMKPRWSFYPELSDRGTSMTTTLSYQPLYPMPRLHTAAAGSLMTASALDGWPTCLTQSGPF